MPRPRLGREELAAVLEHGSAQGRALCEGQALPGGVEKLVVLPEQPRQRRVQILEAHRSAPGRPRIVPHLVSEALYLRDPDGNGLELYHDRPREEWPVTQAERLSRRETLRAKIAAHESELADDTAVRVEGGTINLYVPALSRAALLATEDPLARMDRQVLAMVGSSDFNDAANFLDLLRSDAARAAMSKGGIQLP